MVPLLGRHIKRKHLLAGGNPPPYFLAFIPIGIASTEHGKTSWVCNVVRRFIIVSLLLGRHSKKCLRYFSVLYGLLYRLALFPLRAWSA